MKLKNILMSALSLVLVAAVAVGGTYAYLTSEDSDVNVMTLGNVSIEQLEYERAKNEDGTWKTATVDDRTSYVLQPFTQAKPLLPSALNTTTWEGWGWDGTPVRNSQVGSYGGMSVFKDASNAQDKFVYVKNTGKTDAYVRTLVAVEVGNSSIDMMNFNVHLGAWTENEIGTIAVDGNNYYVLEYVYTGAQLSDGSWRHANGILPAGDMTYNSFGQVYIHSKATNEDMIALDGNANGTLDILVLSQAVQAAGFENAQTALDTAFGTSADNAATWFGGEAFDIPTTVSTADAMYAALEAGAKDLVVVGATIDENNFNGRYYQDRNIDFVDCTFTADMDWMYINDVNFTNCTFDCTGSDNVAVHYDQLFGDAVFTDCTFSSGEIQIGKGSDDASITFNNCVFGETTTTSIWAEKGIKVYCPTVFNNCEFNNRVVVAGSNGLAITFNSCTMNGGTPVFCIDNSNGIIRGGNIPDVTINGETLTTVSTAAELTAALAEGGYVMLTDNVELTDTLMSKKDVVIDLNGNTLTAPSSSAMFQSQSNAAPSMTITSSVEGAEINVTGGDTSVLLGYGSTEISNVSINVTGCDNKSPNPFKVYGDLTIGEGTVVNIDYLGSSLISNNGAVAIVIDGAEFNIGTFKTNATPVIALNQASTLEIKNTEMTISNFVISNFGNIFISKADGVTIKDFKFNVTGDDGNAYTYEATDKYRVVQK